MTIVITIKDTEGRYWMSDFDNVHDCKESVIAAREDGFKFISFEIYKTE